MSEWKFNVGEVLQMGKTSRMIIVGRKEEECISGAIQRFYSIHQIVNSYSIGIGITNTPMSLPDYVLEEIVKMAEELKEGK